MNVALYAAELSLIIAGLYAAFALYVQHRKPSWSVAFIRRRLAVLWTLLVTAGAAKITGDVIDGDSHPTDQAILLFIREHMPPSLGPVFRAITLTGSQTAMLSLLLLAVAVLLLRKHHFEAFLVVASTIAGETVVYAIKALVGRERPQLWTGQWYSGSSFPSGHTLVIAAFATAVALSVARLQPAARDAAVSAAFVWIVLVALSRLVLGAHWPTDVLAAACIGAGLPLAISLGADFWRARRSARTSAA